jgi:hypothetical protein
VGTILTFQLSGADAELIAREIGLKNADLLTGLSVGEVWAKHPTYGRPYHPKLFGELPMKGHGKIAALRQHWLRNTYPRRRVEEKIRRFLTRATAEVSPSPHPPVDRWPRSLHILRTALRRAIKEDGGTITPEPNEPPRIVADVQQVRTKFLADQVSDANTADAREEDREKAFRRALHLAQQRRLIGAVERDGTQWVWPIK